MPQGMTDWGVADSAPGTRARRLMIRAIALFYSAFCRARETPWL